MEEKDGGDKEMITAVPTILTADAINYYIEHPAHFAYDQVNVTPEDYQGQILDSLVTNQRVAVKSGHGTGKTAVESWAALWFLSTRPFPRVPCTAPTEHQLHDILWPEINKWLRQSNVAPLFKWTITRVYLHAHPEEWFAVARTASKPEALAGFHADHLLFIVDESSGVQDEIFQPVNGALTGEDTKLLMCANPTQTVGVLYDAFTKDRDLYALFTLNSENSPRVTKEYCDFIARKWGNESDVYRVRVLGLFPKSQPDSFIPLDFCERNATNAITVKYPRVIDIGVDVARYGDDETVLASVADVAKHFDTEVHYKNDVMEVSGYVIAKAVYWHKKYGANTRINIKVDCDGVGAGVHDRVREVIKERNLLNIYVYEVHFGGAGGQITKSDPIEYKNTSAIMWGLVREALRINMITILDDDELVTQLSNRKYVISSDGKIELERKEYMKKRGLKSPDRADALCLALYSPPGKGKKVRKKPRGA